MLAHRIIPTVLVRGQQLVKGKQFHSWRSVGVAEQAARIYAARSCDELILLDIAATPEGRGPDLKMIEKWTEGHFTPITVGGGIRSVDDVRDVLRIGADKVAICSEALNNSELVQDCASKFGSQAVVVSIDVSSFGYVCGNGGNDSRVIEPIYWAQKMEQLGAGEILLTSIDREGMMNGYDLGLIHEVSKAVNIPVIAHGGCGTYEHMREAIQYGADAVAAGSMFQFTDQTPQGAAKYLAAAGIEVRLLEGAACAY